MTVAMMKKLAKRLKVPVESGGRLATESTLIAAPSQHILGDEASDDHIAQATASRHSIPSGLDEQVMGATIIDSAVGECLLQDGDDDGDVRLQLQDLEKVKQKILARRAQVAEEASAATRRMRAAKGATSSSDGAGGSAAGSVGPYGAPGRPRKFIPVPEVGPSVVVAMEYMPPGFSISEDIRRENRWRLRGPPSVIDGPKSKSFGRGSNRSEWQALVVLLEVVWQAHLRATGGRCRFDFAGLEL